MERTGYEKDTASRMRSVYYLLLPSSPVSSIKKVVVNSHFSLPFYFFTFYYCRVTGGSSPVQSAATTCPP